MRGGRDGSYYLIGGGGVRGKRVIGRDMWIKRPVLASHIKVNGGNEPKLLPGRRGREGAEI